MASARALQTVRALTRPAQGVRAAWRRPAPRARFASEHGRAPRPGRELAVAAIGRDQLVNEVGAALADPAAVHLVHTGNLMRASDVIEQPTDFFTDLVAALYDHAVATATAPAEGLDRLLGADLVRGTMLSLEERSLRLGKALMTAVAEVSAHGDAGVLLDQHWRDALIDFARGYVMRSGYEHGSRFELRQMVLMEALRSPALELRHQLRLPSLAGTQMLSGPDTVLYYEGYAYDIQLKAFASLDSLFAGSVGFKRSGGSIVKVSGPAIPKQTITDVLRKRPWQNLVPGPLVPFPPDALLPAAHSDWVPAATPSAYLIDDAYLIDRVMMLLSDARRRTRRNRIDLATLAASDAAKERVRRLLGGEQVVSVNDPEELWDAATSNIRLVLLDYEREINAYLRTSEVVRELGARRSVRLLAASEPTSRLLDVLGVGP